jgi:hypothetical protein
MVGGCTPLRRVAQAVHRHVFEHAPAQRADRPGVWLVGSVGHFESSLS